jgi:hypothetical protein
MFFLYEVGTNYNISQQAKKIKFFQNKIESF